MTITFRTLVGCSNRQAIGRLVARPVQIYNDNPISFPESTGSTVTVEPVDSGNELTTTIKASYIICNQVKGETGSQLRWGRGGVEDSVCTDFDVSLMMFCFSGKFS